MWPRSPAQMVDWPGAYRCERARTALSSARNCPDEQKLHTDNMYRHCIASGRRTEDEALGIRNDPCPTSKLTLIQPVHVMSLARDDFAFES
ncbi:hypothetical protein LshimejAT787_1801310 [Lyophyllum shimeji]|uniref:Uncharacterized protein n=1 Tax=Lyophyllum shimeji TaxID=47721 RepID=A0A9P3Q073_LYOSH|nr:hypothetical protein LshimejAT787_1801310 [Lyophyllum shimeji]